MTLSRPARGAWVEIATAASRVQLWQSRPARGAWVEITFREGYGIDQIRRAPQGARGLKCLLRYNKHRHSLSRPARGAWVEMPTNSKPQIFKGSRPARGAWVEMQRYCKYAR